MNNKTHNQTDFLFPTPSFLIGAGSIFNIAGNYFDFNNSKSDKEADAQAISSDWSLIGSDLYQSIEEFETDLEVTNG